MDETRAQFDTGIRPRAVHVDPFDDVRDTTDSSLARRFDGGLGHGVCVGGRYRAYVVDEMVWGFFEGSEPPYYRLVAYSLIALKVCVA